MGHRRISGIGGLGLAIINWLLPGNCQRIGARFDKKAALVHDWRTTFAQAEKETMVPTETHEESVKDYGAGQFVGSVQKALDILDAFVPQKPELSLTELAELLSLNKSTLFNLLRTLEGHGYIVQSPQTKRYRLGLRFLDRAALVTDYADVSRVAPPFLDELRNKVEENIHLGVLEDGQVVYLYRAQGPHTLSVNSRLGMRVPAHATAMGKVILAYRSENEIDSVIIKYGLCACTPNTITELPVLKECLREVKMRGYATDAEEHHLGSECVAAPIFDLHHQVIAAVSVSIPSVRMTGSRPSHIIRNLTETARMISEQFGWRDQISSGKKEEIEALELQRRAG
jgi:IclR family transcriptional regulator, KDG regulon repressor